MSIDIFFNPKSVAVIGANREPNKIGHVIFKNFVDHFKGDLYPVNPNANEILGKKCYAKVTDIPHVVDLAVIAVPAQLVSFVLHECAVKKVKSVVVITGGFSEVGRKDLEDEIKEIVRRSGMRLIGVNCLGVFDARSRIDTLFLPEFKLHRPKPGYISFISQSGAVGSIMLDWLAMQGIGVSKFISYGNATDINEVDLINYLGNDPDTKVICMYLEGVSNGREMMKAAEKVSKKKPIIVVKGGRTKEGSSAVSSHTGSLAGDDLIFDTAFKQCGIIRANSTIEMFDFAKVLVEQPVAKGDNIQIVTNGGGFGVLATDAIISAGFNLAKMKEENIKEIEKKLPPYAVIKNPMDLVGDANAKDYEIALKCIEKDNNVDAVLCIVLFQTAGINSDVVDVIVNFSKKKSKPIVVCSAGGEFTLKHTKLLEEAGVPVFDSPERAAKALGVLSQYGQIFKD